VIILNNNDLHYQGEVWIVTNDTVVFKDNNYNYVGYINKNDLTLLDNISDWVWFGFKILK
jgi:hypothetical protein